jgi:hypothetical protein
MKFNCPYLDDVSEDKFVQNYNATTVVHTQSNPSSRQKGELISKHMNGLGMIRSFVMCPDSA